MSPPRLPALFLLTTVLAPATAFAQGYSPDEAPARMTVAEGLRVRLVASEPLVRQPVAIDFDDRGRLWVIQYLQYPNPEGLKRVEVDRYSRTKYDRRPEPPPRGPKGHDRITILEDTDGDGRMDRSKDFVTGLNLASGFAFGNGGVYVLNVPYLLFYADRDRDDVPDGDPEVLLTGFGMEDAHSVANSLTWGPDGWLYGLQGSTVTANIDGVEFQQGVWRFHPGTKRFELFAEGGGNMWGLDFDRHGDLFASTNVGGNVMLHFVQGGYYWKQFGKHGPLHNPYTFGFFDHVKHEGVQGGHVAVAGLFYHADAWPERYHGKYLAADLLGHAAHWHEVTPLGSTFQARQLGDLLQANDTWFAPTDMTLGPDGSVYISDWHDQRTAHPDPDADWDRSNGRIYALDGPRHQAGPFGFDMQAYSTDELIEQLRHPNVWYARRARRILAERRDPEAAPKLRRAVREWAEPSWRLQALWALHGGGGLDDQAMIKLLDHPDEDVRAWLVRWIGDTPEICGRFAPTSRSMAAQDPSAQVRSQLASTAKRLRREDGLAIVWELLWRDVDAVDPHIPLLLWWAVEHHALPFDETVRRALLNPSCWQSGMYRSTIAPRLARRYAAEGGDSSDETCAELLESAPHAEAARPLLAGIDEGLAGPKREVADVLKRSILSRAATAPDDPLLIRLSARLGDSNATARALAVARDHGQPEPVRLAMFDLLGQVGDRSMLRPLLDLATSESNATVAGSAMQASARFDDPAILDALLAVYPEKPPAWRARARSWLFSRKAWASPFLDEIERRRFDPAEVPMDEVGRIALLKDSTLDARVKALWGRVTGPTPEEKLAEVRRLNNDLRAATGDRDSGQALFKKHCSTCHRFNGEGNLVGPELTHANRQDRDFLLVSLVDPNGVIRREYQATLVEMKDGRVLTGLIAEQSPNQLTLIDAKAERATLPRDQIEAMSDSPVSLMPENLYRELSPQELRDLFAYLQAP